MPHISVMIPVFNREHLLGHTVESVLRQTFGDFDVVIVDDASTDDSVGVAKRCCAADSRVSLSVNPRNLGLTRNWNRCVQLARGPLVQIMQSDDLIDRDYLSLVASKFEELPTLGFVAASSRSIDGVGNVIDEGTPRPERLYRAGDDAVMRILTGHPHVSSIVVRAECFARLGEFDIAIWHGPDIEMDARLAASYDFYDFGAVHTSFRRHGSNMGLLEYLREDFLAVDMKKKQLAWGYLSEAGRHGLGVQDLGGHLRRDGSRTALTGALASLAYGRRDLAGSYLRQARLLDRGCWRGLFFWKVCAVHATGKLGMRVVQRRLGIRREDEVKATAVEASLRSLS
jgi:glycosyltransferase involved in cell wall biosynthesis